MPGGLGVLAVRVVDLVRASVEESPRLQASVTAGRKRSFYLLVAARSAGHLRRRPLTESVAVRPRGGVRRFTDPWRGVHLSPHGWRVLGGLGLSFG